jgi:hypothetical protein
MVSTMTRSGTSSGRARRPLGERGPSKARLTISGAGLAAFVVTGVAYSAVATAGGPSEATADDAATTGVAAAAPEQLGGGPVEITSRGDVRKDLGEPAGLSLAGTDEVGFELTLEAISVQSTCVGRGLSVSPENEVFVVVDLVASIPPELPDAVEGGDALYMPLGAEAFTIIGPDGEVQPGVATDAAWACLEDDDLAAPFVGPGEVVSGRVVLDSTMTSGSVVYAPQGGPGWAWEFEG